MGMGDVVAKLSQPRPELLEVFDGTDMGGNGLVKPRGVAMTKQGSQLAFDGFTAGTFAVVRDP